MEPTGIVSIRHKGSFWQLLREVTLVAPHYQDFATQTQSSIPKARPDLQGKVISSVRPSAVAKADGEILEPVVSHRPFSSHPCTAVSPKPSQEEGFTKICPEIQIRKTTSSYKLSIT